MIGEVTHWDVKKLPPGVTAKQYCDVVLKALKKDSALRLNTTDGVIRHACYAEGAKYEYICPECSQPLENWAKCSERLNATGHAKEYDTIEKLKKMEKRPRGGVRRAGGAGPRRATGKRHVRASP